MKQTRQEIQAVRDALSAFIIDKLTEDSNITSVKSDDGFTIDIIRFDKDFKSHVRKFIKRNRGTENKLYVYDGFHDGKLVPIGSILKKKTKGILENYNLEILP